MIHTTRKIAKRPSPMRLSLPHIAHVRTMRMTATFQDMCQATEQLVN